MALHLTRLPAVFFRGYRTRIPVFGHTPRHPETKALPKDVLHLRSANSNVFRLVTAYRDNGHLQATTNPFRFPEYCQKLSSETFDLDPDAVIDTNGLLRMPSHSACVRDIETFLQKAYCGNISANLSYLPCDRKEWLAEEIESAASQDVGVETKRAVAEILSKSQAFDRYLGVKFPTLKRYGLEGAEGMLPFFMVLLTESRDIDTIVLAMTHRGRMNLLTLLLQTPAGVFFRKIKGGPELTTDASSWIGDVVSHITCSTKINNVHVTMLPNPSHLELVNPVSMGKARAKQMGRHVGNYSSNENMNPILNVQVHGDAAFSGQGVNQEMLGFSRVPHFSVGGSIHLVVNNQLGFTTPGERGRSSRYSSDLAKSISAPVLHVNGEDPAAVSKVSKIALKYQKQFREDIFVELHCYRRHGHNELDDPTFTNPQLYKVIHETKTLPDSYKERLVQEGVLRQDEIEKWETDYAAYLNSEFKNEEKDGNKSFQNRWKGQQNPSNNITTWNTGIDRSLLDYVGQRSVSFPEYFKIHPHLLKTHVTNRLSDLSNGTKIDWSTAEALAFGSLLYQNYNVRISGQDVGRGTFSHRHAMLVDQESGEIYIPLNNLLIPQQGHIEVANSSLSEEAVLAFEYGFSIESPRTLCIWEAQFGDFANGAQAVIDTYVTSGDAKWARSSGITLLLPHGYDGAGPEHSSCRLERFLQLSTSSESKPDGDNVNIEVVVPTTPAQYFHLLRRQQVRNFRTPLVVASPKTLLRLAAASSSLQEFLPGNHFKSVLVNDSVNATQMVFTSGKHFYALDSVKPPNTVLVRVESLCPFPSGELQRVVKKHPKVTDFVWSQEEPKNMGAWSFIQPRFENLVGVKPRYAGREELAAPAYGLASLHKKSQEEIIRSTFSNV